MKNYKIYREENYIKIITDQDYYGFVKDVFVDKSNVKKPEYRFFNIRNWNENIALSIGQIQKEDGLFYTEQEFDTFYRENTGNFKSPDIGATFVNVNTLPTVDIDMNAIYVLPDSSWNIYNGTYWVKEDVEKIIYLQVSTLPTTNIKTNIIYILPNGSWNLYNGINWLKEDVQFVVVNTYADLPISPTNNKWFWVSNSQGVSWIPSFLGGTYYPKGVYYYNGVNYEYVETPYQATQAEVNIGTNNDKFVTPLTLKESTQWDTKLNVTDLPSNLVLYPTTSTSDVPTYFKLVTDIHDVDYDTTAIDVNTGVIANTAQLISSLSTEASLIIGNPGVFNITVVGNIRKISGSGNADFYFEVYKRDNVGVETLIGTSSNTATATSSVYEQFNATALWDDGIFTSTDRIVLKFYANRITGGSNPEYQFQFGGTTPVRALVPIPLSTIGYTKTEVDALLNSKQNTLFSETNIKTINGNSVLGSGDIVISGGSNTQVKIQSTDISSIISTQADTGINFVLQPNSTYALEGYFYGGCTSTGGMKFGWRDIPAGVSGIQSVLAFNGVTNNSGNAGAVWAIGAVIPAFAGGSSVQQIRYAATITTTTTGGTITAQFSSNSAGQTSWFRALSRLTIIKL